MGDFSLFLESSEQNSASIALFRKLKGIEVLIVQRKNPPEAKAWALPGGHIEDKEAILIGALRELKEETGVKLRTLVKIGKYKKNYVFAAVISSNTFVKAGSDASKAKWVSIANLPELAFHDDKVIYDAVYHIFGSKF